MILKAVAKFIGLVILSKFMFATAFLNGNIYYRRIIFHCILF